MEKFKEKITFCLENKNTEIFIIALILINLIIFVLQTDVNLNRNLYQYFNIIELISVAIFTIEYFLRLFTLKHIRDVFNAYMLIDLFAILPFYLSFVTVNTIFLRALRLFRLLRIAKIARYSDALNNIKNAFKKRQNELIVTAGIFLFAVFISSTLIYFAENQAGQEAFKSIPSAFWWSVVTFTTVGYGDAYPVTSLGKIIAGLTAIFGVGLHGLLIGVISTAFMDVIKKETEIETLNVGKIESMK